MKNSKNVENIQGARMKTGIQAMLHIVRNIMVFASVLIGGVLGVQVCEAATFYVATNGNDSSPGTEAEPFRTLNRGVIVLAPGDTLMVKNGVYAESLENRIPSGTSWSNAVTVKAMPGHRPTIKPTAGAFRVLNFDHFGGIDSFIEVDGFILDGENVAHEVVKITGGSHHIRIKNSELKNAPQSCMLLAGSFPTGASPSHNLEIINNDIHHCGANWRHHGIYYGAGADSLIERNNIHHNASRGIQIFGSSESANLMIRFNRVYDNDQLGDHRAAVVLGGGGGGVFYNNIVFNTSTPTGSGGVQIQYNAGPWKVYNNTVYNISPPRGYTGYGIGIFPPGHSGAEIYNNLIHTTSYVGIFVYVDADRPIIKNNLTFNWGGKRGVNDIGGIFPIIQDNITDLDPLLANPSAGDFNLQETSPAIDAGAVLADVPDDFDRNQRPWGSAHDIGAYEFALGLLNPPDDLQIAIE